MAVAVVSLIACLGLALGAAPVSAYSPAPPTASTSTTAGPTTTSGPTTTTPQSSPGGGGNGSGGTTAPEQLGSTVPAPSGHASEGAGLANNGNGGSGTGGGAASGSTLPFTGADIAELILIALLLILIGYAARRAGRHRREGLG